MKTILAGNHMTDAWRPLVAMHGEKATDKSPVHDKSCVMPRDNTLCLSCRRVFLRDIST